MPDGETTVVSDSTWNKNRERAIASVEDRQVGCHLLTDDRADRRRLRFNQRCGHRETSTFSVELPTSRVKSNRRLLGYQQLDTRDGFSLESLLLEREVIGGRRQCGRTSTPRQRRWWFRPSRESARPLLLMKAAATTAPL